MKKLLLSLGCLLLAATGFAEDTTEWEISMPNSTGEIYNSSNEKKDVTSSTTWVYRYVEPANSTTGAPAVTLQWYRGNMECDVTNKRFVAAANGTTNNVNHGNITGITTTDGYYIKSVSFNMVAVNGTLKYTLTGSTETYTATSDGTGTGAFSWTGAAGTTFPGLTVTQAASTTCYLTNFKVVVAKNPDDLVKVEDTDVIVNLDYTKLSKSGTGTYVSWIKDSNMQLTCSNSVNNIAVNGTTETTPYISLASGLNSHVTGIYTLTNISSDYAAYYIAGYSFLYKTYSGQTALSVSGNGVTGSVSTDEYQRFYVTGIGIGTDAKFTTGSEGNLGINVADLKILLRKYPVVNDEALTDATDVTVTDASDWTNLLESTGVNITSTASALKTSDGAIIAKSGTGSANTFRLVSTDPNKYIAGYSFDMIANSTALGTLTDANAATHVKVANPTTSQLYAATCDQPCTELSTACFTINGTDAEVKISNLKVQLVDRTFELPKIVMRYDGTSNYNVTYRIPAIATVGTGDHAGRLVAIADYRHSGSDIGTGSGVVDLRMVYSDDNGLNWSEPACLKDANGNEVSKGNGKQGASASPYPVDCGFGDPALVADRESAKLLLVSCAGFPGFFGCSVADPQDMVCWTSEDGGTTWSAYREITEEVRALVADCEYGPIGGMFIGSGRIMQSSRIKVGDYYRIYMVLSGRTDGGNQANWVIYSDEFGAAGSWRMLGDANLPPRSSAADEPKAEELPDGSVLFSARRFNVTGRAFNIFRYTNVNEGTGYWDGLVNSNLCDVATNWCDGDPLNVPVKRVSDGKITNIALQSLPISNVRKFVGVFWKALDEDADLATTNGFASNWDGYHQVSYIDRTGASIYSSMSVMQSINNDGHEGDIAFLLEDQTSGSTGGLSMSYITLTIKQITGGLYEKVTGSDKPDTSAPEVTETYLDLLISNAGVDASNAKLVAAKQAALSEKTYANYAEFHRILKLMKEGLSVDTTTQPDGTYVGKMTTESAAAIAAAATALANDPTEENLKHLQNCKKYAKMITIKEGINYTLKNRVQTTSNSVSYDRYLAVNTTDLQLTTTTTSTEANYFKFTLKEGSEDQFYMTNTLTVTNATEGTSTTTTYYVSTCANGDNQAYKVVTDQSSAYPVVLDLTSASAPYAVLKTTDSNHSGKAALHMESAGGTIVRWFAAADKSHWDISVAESDKDSAMTADYLDNTATTETIGEDDDYIVLTAPHADAILRLVSGDVTITKGAPATQLAPAMRRASSDLPQYTVSRVGKDSGEALLNWVLGPETKAVQIAVTAATTGIEEVGVKPATDGAIYDLQGRRVKNPTRGLYIINGRKIMVK